MYLPSLRSLRLNFTRTDSYKAIDVGYIVFRVGGFVNPARIGVRNDRVAPCTDSTTLSEFTVNTFYSAASNGLWSDLRNDQAEALSTPTKASEHPEVLEARNDISPARASTFCLSPSNPPVMPSGVSRTASTSTSR